MTMIHDERAGDTQLTNCFNSTMPDQDLPDRIAGNIRALRQRRGITREQLAATADVDPQMIKRIESGRANPALVVLSRLASALMISLSLVLGADVSAEPSMLANKAESEPFDAETVGETIASLRKHRQLSRRAFARMVDVRTVTLSRYESAIADARLLAVEPMARALGMPADEFVREIELRQRESDRTRSGWHEPAPGVQCRLVSSGGHSQLWEWRLAPATNYVDEPMLAITEEIATAIRGEVRVEVGDKVHRLRRGGSVALPVGMERRFANTGDSTARLLRFQVRN